MERVGNSSHLTFSNVNFVNFKVSLDERATGLLMRLLRNATSEDLHRRCNTFVYKRFKTFSPFALCWCDMVHKMQHLKIFIAVVANAFTWNMKFLLSDLV